MINWGVIRQFVLTTAIVLIGAGLAWADPPRVTACDSDTGAGFNLAQALAAGGEIRFSCPAGTTIRVTGRHVLKQNTVIDGGDAVTLDGRGAFGPMLTSLQGVNLTLRRIKVRGFAQEPFSHLLPPAAALSALGIIEAAPSVLSAEGDAEFDHVTIEANDFPIRVAGTAIVKEGCAFVGNRGILTMQVDGAAQIENSRFTGNSLELFIRAGWVRNCAFDGQTGGALLVYLPTGPVEIRHSTFSGIHGGPALSLSQQSGRNGPQTITLRRNVFHDNAGGAIALYDVALRALTDIPQGTSVQKGLNLPSLLSSLSPAAFSLRYNRFGHNRGQRGGAIAADLAHTGGMISTGDLFDGNTAAGDGGAVAVTGGALQMSHALFKANRAGGRGAALSVAPDASASLSNTLVVKNAGPNGAIAGNAVTLTNVTVADNQAVGLLLSAKAHVGNILLAHNVPADCAGVPAGVFQGGGLQSDGTCPGLPVGEAFLDPFYVPGANSPALTAGDAPLCRSPAVAGVDLVFQARNNPDNCALGAFERPPLRKFVPKTETHPVHANPSDEFSDYDAYQPPPTLEPTAPPSYEPMPTPTTKTPRSYKPTPTPITKAPRSYKPTPTPTTKAPRSYKPTPTPTTKASRSYKPTPTPATKAQAPYESPPTLETHTQPTSAQASHATPTAPTESTVMRDGPQTSPQTSADAEPVKRVLAAVKAEEASPIERVHVFMTSGNIADEYYIDRVNPGRFRMLVNPRQGGPERIVVDRMQWVRTGRSEPWFKTPAQESSAPFPFAAELFRNGLTRAVESPGPGSSRNVEGDFAWTNGTACEGRMLLRIDAGGLPSLLRFEGNCDKKPVRFRVAFSYTGPVTITPPKLLATAISRVNRSDQPNFPSPSPAGLNLVKFVNTASNFSILVPTNVFDFDTARPDKQRTFYSSKDGRTKLLAYARLKNARETLTSVYNDLAKEHTPQEPQKLVDYKVLRDKWCVVSGNNGPGGYYVKVVLRGEMFLYMCLEYDVKGSPLSPEQLTAMSQAFDGR